MGKTFKNMCKKIYFRYIERFSFSGSGQPLKISILQRLQLDQKVTEDGVVHTVLY